ncbi:hypothetical protein D3C75_924460 [compost metagenome]
MRIDIIQHFIGQIVRQVAGVNTRKTARGMMRRRVTVLPGGKCDELQRSRPSCDVVTQTVAVDVFEGGVQTMVEKQLRFVVSKRKLLATDFQQLIAHA